MPTKKAPPKDIDAYIAQYPKDTQAILNQLRAIIRQAAPGAQETIKYQMPTFTLSGNLVYFSVWKDHIGLYPSTTGSAKFNQALAPYIGAKSSVKLPLDEPLPAELIRQLVVYRVKDNLARAKAKAKAKAGA